MVEFPIVAFLVVASFLVLGSRVVIIVGSTVLVAIAYLDRIGLLPFVVDLGHSSQTPHPKYKMDG